MTGGQTAVSPFICSPFFSFFFNRNVWIGCVFASMCVCRFERWVTELFGSTQEVHGGVRSVLLRERKQHNNPQKLVLSSGLILLCETSFYVVSDRHVWTPTVKQMFIRRLFILFFKLQSIKMWKAAKWIHLSLTFILQRFFFTT